MLPKPVMRNTLFYGDNLPILIEYIPSESIDLIYLDPPFNSNRSYNVLFKDESGVASEAQLTAFDDTWHWGKTAEKTYQHIITDTPLIVAQMIGALREYIGSNQMMAYLVMMTARLVELHRVLKSTGSLYLHCDPTASHYLKVIMDTIFGVQYFQNEIIWKRTGAHGGAKRWGPIHDTILFYSKGTNFTWNKVFEDYDESYLEKFYRFLDKEGRYGLVTLTGAGTRTGDSGKPWRGINPTNVGRHWAVPNGALRGVAEGIEIEKLSTQEKLDLLDSKGLIYWPPKGEVPRQKRYLVESMGNPVQDIISDILPISSQAAERLGYPTQKPITLLERIIAASSNPGDIVLDPFCGCGTAIAAAQKLNRNWIGIDITHLAITLQKYRLKDMFNLAPGVDYDIIGEPTSLNSARQLAKDNRYQFQWWALSLVKAKPVGGQAGSKKGKKGKDKGIDGVISFIEDPKGKPSSIIIQVKSGHVKSGDIRDLIGTVKNENAAMGVFITLEPPTEDMQVAAISDGFYTSEMWQHQYPKIQILTIEELLSGSQIQMPPSGYGTFKQAPKEKKKEGKQTELDL